MAIVAAHARLAAIDDPFDQQVPHQFMQLMRRLDMQAPRRAPCLPPPSHPPSPLPPLTSSPTVCFRSCAPSAAP
jgi:hypothetical protein